jgi:plastocyanin
MSLQRMILLAALALAACSDDGDGGQGPDGETPEGDVLVRNDFFDPAQLQVTPGSTVVWAWASNGRDHNVTFDDQVASETQSSGTFERTFETAGTFAYHCTIHGTATSGMRGAVTVAASGAPDTGGDGDDGGDDGDGPGGYPGGY